MGSLNIYLIMIILDSVIQTNIIIKEIHHEINNFDYL
jgi:hypothetical protein